MKKNKLSIGLVASFIGALALTSCKSTPTVTPSDDSMIELVGYDGEKIVVNTDAFYGKYSNSKDGTQIYYNAVLEALVRKEYPDIGGKDGYKSYKDLLAEAEKKVTSAKRTATENSDNNGTSYDEEWDNILETNNCEDEEDLKQHYLYNLELEELKDKYLENNLEHADVTLKDQYIGLDKDWKPVDEVDETEPLYPYHILHVLVSLDASESDYVRGTISQENAEKLWTVVRKLIDGNYKFENIAAADSDDPGSKAKFGDVGLMTTKTSFYNEFKLGIYAYDAIMSGVNDETILGEDAAPIYKALGLDKDAKVVTETTSTEIKTAKVQDLITSEMYTRVNTPVKATDFNIPTVPYQVFQRMSKLADNEKIEGVSVEASNAALPRNVLYNQFLNFHSPFVITDEDISYVEWDPDHPDVHDETITTSRHVFDKDDSHYVDGTLALENPLFTKEATIHGSTKGILTDSHGDVVIGVRSSAGIHFMVMRKSIFKNTNYAATPSKTQTLQDYYTTKIPGEKGFPEEGDTYVYMQDTSDESVYQGRADEIKDAIKSSDFDPAYDYRIYEELLDRVAGKIHFSDEVDGKSAVKDNIDKYIELLRATSKDSAATSMNETWQSYLQTLSYQNTVRGQVGALVPTTCAFNFNKDGKALYDKGGYCYVK